MGVFGEWAEKYFKLGLTPIPVDGKRPILENWQSFSTDQIDDEAFDKLLFNYGSAKGIGVVLGRYSNIVAFDLDYMFNLDRSKFKGSDEEYNLIKKTVESEQDQIKKEIIEMLPHTPCVKIGKEGKSTYFYKARGNFQTMSVQRNGLTLFDVLWDGRQTVMPPSVHPETGKPYRWINGDLIKHIEDLPELEWSVVEEISKKYEGNFIKNGLSGASITGRNDLLKRKLFGMFRRGLTVEACVSHIMEIDRSICVPPLFSDPDEFKRLYKTPEKAALKFVRSCYKTFISNLEKDLPSRPSSGFGGSSSNGGATPEAPSEIKHDKNGDPYVEIKYYNRYEIIRNNKLKIYDKPDYERMGDDFFNKQTMSFSNSEDIVYDAEKKIWKNVDKYYLPAIIVKENAGFLSNPPDIAKFEIIIRSKCHESLFQWKDRTGLLNMANGVLEIASGKLREHDRYLKFKYCLGHSYDPKADCPEFKKIIKQILVDDETVAKYQDFCGYVLIGGRPFLELAMILLGKVGSNGKSTINAIQEAVIGSNNYSSISLKNLGKKESIVHLDGKLANISGESPSSSKLVIESDAFKQIVSGEEQEAKYLYKDSFKFKPTARLIMNMNSLPNFGEFGNPIHRRLCIIPFDAVFTDKTKDTRLQERIIKSELSGILNWYLEGSRRVMRNGCLTTSARSDAALDGFKRETDRVYDWAMENLEIDPEVSKYAGFYQKVSRPTADFYSRFMSDMIKEGNRQDRLPEPRGFTNRLIQVFQMQLAELGVPSILKGKFEIIRDGDLRSFERAKQVRTFIPGLRYKIESE